MFFVGDGIHLYFYLGVRSSTSTIVPTTTAAPPAAQSAVFAEDVSPLFRLSPFYFVVLGTMLTVSVGMAVSGAVRALRERKGRKGGFGDLAHPDLFSPPVARLVRRRMGLGPGGRQLGVELYQSVPQHQDQDAAKPS